MPIRIEKEVMLPHPEYMVTTFICTCIAKHDLDGAEPVAKHARVAGFRQALAGQRHADEPGRVGTGEQTRPCALEPCLIPISR
jgi:hypothetical protein